jgi:hypothetical protein
MWYMTGFRCRDEKENEVKTCSVCFEQDQINVGGDLTKYRFL